MARGNFIAEVVGKLYSNSIVRYTVLGVGVIVGSMILYYVSAVFYDLCACDTCPSLTWMLGCDQRGYTAVKGNDADNTSPSNSNMQRDDKMVKDKANDDDEEKANRSKDVKLSSEAASQIEMRFKTLEKALEVEKSKRMEKESQLDKVISELNMTKKMYEALDEEIRIIKETGSGRSTPRGVSPMAKRVNDTPESSAKQRSKQDQARSDNLFSPPTVEDREDTSPRPHSQVPLTAAPKSVSKTVIDTLIHPDGVYEGETISSVANGKGIKRYTGKWAGQVYEGSFRNNKSHGHGTFSWPSGAVYTGDWKNGKIEGKGTYFFADGATYEGDMKNGMSHGFGKYIYVDKRTYEGEFQNDKQHGVGTYKSQNGTILFQGEYRNGKRVI